METVNNRAAVRPKIPSSREPTDPGAPSAWSLSTSFSLPIRALTRGVAVAVLIESDRSELRSLIAEQNSFFAERPASDALWAATYKMNDQEDDRDDQSM